MAAVSALEAESEVVLTLTLMCGEKEVLDSSVVELGWCSYCGHVVMFTCTLFVREADL